MRVAVMTYIFLQPKVALCVYSSKRQAATSTVSINQLPFAILFHRPSRCAQRKLSILKANTQYNTAEHMACLVSLFLVPEHKHGAAIAITLQMKRTEHLLSSLQLTQLFLHSKGTADMFVRGQTYN